MLNNGSQIRIWDTSEIHKKKRLDIAFGKVPQNKLGITHLKQFT